jgi:hypothetical protein
MQPGRDWEYSGAMSLAVGVSLDQLGLIPFLNGAQ